LKSKWIIILFICLFANCMLLGCSQKEKKPEQTTSDGKPQAPAGMDKIRSELDTIIAELEKKMKQSKSSLLQNTQVVKEEEGQQPEKKSEGPPGGQNQQQKGENMLSDWQKEEDSLRKIHQSWNEVEPEAMKAGLNVQKRNQFENDLKSLTFEIGQKQLEGSLIAAVNLVEGYANLVEVFRTPVPPGYYKVTYEAMAATAQAGRNNWEAAQGHVPSLTENWESLRPKAEEADKKTSAQIDFAVKDMAEAINSQQINLVLIKGEILLNNLKKLEKKF
jgi:hypothetical protein